MRIILDENLPSHVKEEIKIIYNGKNILDVDQELKGILDLKLVDKMDENDIMVTRDRELHKNLLDIGKSSLYYDIQKNNFIEILIKLKYYYNGYDQQTIETSSNMNDHISEGANSLLRKRFDELKNENANLKCRVNILEGKLESIMNTVESVFEENNK